MKKLIISAPFGNYLRPSWATPTLGTYTMLGRGGVLYRLWRCVRTLRPYPRLHAWVNRLGLPNPGIGSLVSAKGCILSIHGFNPDEWAWLALASLYLSPDEIELNLSCPSVGHVDTGVQYAVKYLSGAKLPVIAKLAPLRWHAALDYLLSLGVTSFHCCNTLPTPAGGLSGKPLKTLSLWCVEEVRKRVPGAAIIGGGGVTCMQDAQDYLSAGADRVSVASAFLNPFNWRELRRIGAEL